MPERGVHSRRVTCPELRWVALLVALALAGCLGGQTGQGFSDREPPVTCPRTPVTVAADEPTSLGDSARALAESVRGPWRQPLLWSRTGRRTMLTVELAFTAADARLLQASPDAGQPACSDELELDVGVELATDDGALAESLPAPLRFTSELAAQTAIRLDLTTLSGSYDPAGEFDLSNWKDPELNALLWFSNGTMNGQLSLDGGNPDPSDGETPVSGSVASWPEP